MPCLPQLTGSDLVPSAVPLRLPERFPHLRGIHFKGVSEGETVIKFMQSDFSRLTNLDSIIWSNGRLFETLAQHLTAAVAPRLRSLRLSRGTVLTEEVASALAGLSRLQEFDAEFLTIDSGVVFSSLAQLTGLTRLRLEHLEQKGCSLHAEQLSSLTNLREVLLDHRLASVHVLSCCPGLTSFSSRGKSIKFQGLCSLQHIKSLKQLNISAFGVLMVSTEDAEAFAESRQPCLPSVTQLKASFPNKADVVLGVFPRVRELSCSVMEADVDILAQQTQLRSLQLMCSLGRPDTFAQLAQLTNLTELRVIDWSKIGVTDESLRVVGMSLGRLESLHLSGCSSLSDDGLIQGLATLQGLSFLGLEDAQEITMVGLREALGWLPRLSEFRLCGLQQIEPVHVARLRLDLQQQGRSVKIDYDWFGNLNFESLGLESSPDEGNGAAAFVPPVPLPDSDD